MLKKGASSGVAVSWFGIGALAAMWTWLGILAYLIAFASWLYVLRYIPLSAAFSLVTIVQVFVPISAWLFLGEHISIPRAIGILCVFCGTILVGRTLAKVEKLA